MTADTRHATTNATDRHNWRRSAACQGIDEEVIFSERPSMQARMLGICRGCPVRETCLTDALAYETGEYMVWGVAGGLTDSQRRALRVEALLGNRPNVEQARILTRPVFAGFMHQWRDWPATVVAAELRKLDIIASPVTVRLALWWTGGHAGLLAPVAGDTRNTWMVVRDECRATVDQLRNLGVGSREIAAYLGVSRDAVERAMRAWREQVARGVEAA